VAQVLQVLCPWHVLHVFMPGQVWQVEHVLQLAWSHVSQVLSPQVLQVFCPQVFPAQVEWHVPWLHWVIGVVGHPSQVRYPMPGHVWHVPHVEGHVALHVPQVPGPQLSQQVFCPQVSQEIAHDTQVLTFGQV
jgi:hypothetical protein